MQVEEVKFLNTLIRGLENPNISLVEMCKRLLHTYEGKAGEATKVREDELRFAQLTKKYEDELSSRDNEIEQLKKRIAYLSEKHVRQRQTNVEDTSSMNTQSKLEGDFSLFFEDAREDALDKMKDICMPRDEPTFQTYSKLLVRVIFEAAYERMEKGKEDLLKFFEEMSRGIIQEAPKNSFEFTKKEEKERFQSGSSGTRARNPGRDDFSFPITVSMSDSKYPTEIVDAFMLAINETAHNCKLDCFVEDVKGVIQHRWEECIRKERCKRAQDIKRSLNDVLNHEEVVSYIKKCIQLAWRLVTHVPAMRIGYQSSHLQGLPKDKGPYQGRGTCTSTGVSAEDGSSEIEYLWPALIDGEKRVVHPARKSGH